MGAPPRATFSLAAFLIACTSILASTVSLWWEPAIAVGVVLAMIAVAMVAITQRRIEQQMARTDERLTHLRYRDEH